MARRWLARQWGPFQDWSFEEFEPAPPGAGEISVRVHAAGVNPADAKHVAVERSGVELPVAVGYEISGIISAVGAGAVLGSGEPAEAGQHVVAFRIFGGYATDAVIPADKAFLKPETLPHPEAANLLLAGATAAEMLAVTGAQAGETILVHGASGAVGAAVLQLAVARGVRVIGTAGVSRGEAVSRFGGEPVVYGEGLEDRVRSIAGGPIAAALDCVGTDEAVDVSLALVSDRTRIVTIAAAGRAQADGFRWIVGSAPDSARFRDEVRGELVRLAGEGRLVVPMARTYPLAEAREALELVMGGHAGGKVALIP